MIDESKPYELFDPEYTWKRKTVTVEWDEAALRQVESDRDACERLLAGPLPAAIRRSYCRRCAYEELCFL